MRCDDCSAIIARCESSGSWEAWEAAAVKDCACERADDADWKRMIDSQSRWVTTEDGRRITRWRCDRCGAEDAELDWDDSEACERPVAYCVYGCDDDDDDVDEDEDDAEEDDEDDENELVGGDGLHTCELCGDLLSAMESRNDGLGAGLCTDCQRESCPRCGCWELAACEGGCHWLFIDDDGHAVCSACATEEEAAWARDAAARAAEERGA